MEDFDNIKRKSFYAAKKRRAAFFSGAVDSMHELERTERSDKIENVFPDLKPAVAAYFDVPSECVKTLS